MLLKTSISPLFAAVATSITSPRPSSLCTMYSLATARTTRSATQHAASSAGSPVVPAMNPSSARKKRRAGSPADEKAGPGATPSKKARATPKKKTTVKAAADPGGVGGSDGDEGGLGADSKPRTTPKKFAAYLTTPYPDYARPTAEECEEVTRLLGDMHGLPQRPGRVEKLKEDGPVRVGEACESSALNFKCVRSLPSLYG